MTSYMIDTFMNATKPCKNPQHLRNLMKVHDSVYDAFATKCFKKVMNSTSRQRIMK